jgi:D-alanyl-D-alanine dipeptidase
MKETMKNKKTTYKSLEKQMAQYSHLKSVGSRECNEGFITLPTKDNQVIGVYSNKFNDMQKLFPKIPIRKTIYKKLRLADKKIKKNDPSLQLIVTYGYRSLNIQQKHFNKFLKKLEPKYKTQDELLEAVHKLVAVPKISGHPTGGAIDVNILKNGQKIDMGTAIYDFSTKNIYTFSPFISKKSLENRTVLRTAMIKSGFAPFNGEWWHFSYGDKEWAFVNKREESLYSQKQM